MLATDADADATTATADTDAAAADATADATAADAAAADAQRLSAAADAAVAFATGHATPLTGKDQQRRPREQPLIDPRYAWGATTWQPLLGCAVVP